MNAYWVASINRFVRTQGDIPKGDLWEKVEIDTSQQALIDRLNAYEEKIEKLIVSEPDHLGHQPVAVPTPPPTPTQGSSEVRHATREEVDSWFEPNEGKRPIDKILEKADYAEALIIQDKATERMVHCLAESLVAAKLGLGA